MKMELNRQWNIGKSRSRQADKSYTHDFAQRSIIYSRNSYDTHVRRMNTFNKWLKSSGIKAKKLDDISRDVASQYLMYQQEYGASAWTVSADMLMLNHVGVGSGNWDEPISKRSIKNEYGYVMKRRRLESIQHNRQLTGKEWIDRHQRSYENHHEQLELSRAFGLRRSEVVGGATNNGVRPQSFIQHDSRMYVQTIGKGGKYRVSQCLDQYNDLMYARYGSNALQKPSNSNGLKQIFTSEEPLFQTVGHDVPFHIFRSEYAVNRFNEVVNSGQFQGGKVMSVNGFQATENEFLQVSRDLGHNRVDVLKNYLR